jgi:S1-C subfamily serine protease
VTVPASAVSRVADELLSRGHVRRGFLGVGLHPVQLPDGGKGLIILSLEPGGPAHKAGVIVGDVLLTLDGETVDDTDAVQSHLGAEQIGKTVSAEVLRGGSRLKIEIVPAERPARER